MGIESVCKSLFLAFKFIETHFFLGGLGLQFEDFELSLNCAVAHVPEIKLYDRTSLIKATLVVPEMGSWWFLDRIQVEICGSWPPRFEPMNRSRPQLFFLVSRATNSTWRPTPWRRVARRFWAASKRSWRNITRDWSPGDQRVFSPGKSSTNGSWNPHLCHL